MIYAYVEKELKHIIKAEKILIKPVENVATSSNNSKFKHFLMLKDTNKGKKFDKFA